MTPERAAPEQLAGEPVTTSTDVWALGLLLCELLTGRLPARATSAAASGPTLPAAPEPLDRDLAAIAGRAVRERPDERYATAGELADDVERWLDGKPVRAPTGRAASSAATARRSLRLPRRSWRWPRWRWSRPSSRRAPCAPASMPPPRSARRRRWSISCSRPSAPPIRTPARSATR
jgi:serine/threonine protein kinase